MQITETLSIALPVGEAQAFHTPISREVFEANYRILAATKASLAGKGLQYQMSAGPRIASLTLLDECREDSMERGNLDNAGNPSDLKARALLAEIKRLTMILIPSTTGYDMVPVDTAISRGAIDSDDWREVESSLVFFTCHVALATKGERAALIRATASLLNGVSTSSDISEYASSSLTSTTAEPSTGAGLSVPR